jgi:septation ring formation regulator EzrA
MEKAWEKYAKSPQKLSNNLNGNWQKIDFSRNAIEKEIKAVEKLKNSIGFVRADDEIDNTKNQLSAINVRIEEAIGNVQKIITEIFVSF